MPPAVSTTASRRVRSAEMGRSTVYVGVGVVRGAVRPAGPAIGAHVAVVSRRGSNSRKYPLPPRLHASWLPRAMISGAVDRSGAMGRSTSAIQP